MFGSGLEIADRFVLTRRLGGGELAPVWEALDRRSGALVALKLQHGDAATNPLDVKTRWLKELNGFAFDNYVEWIRITYAVTLTSCPALSLPCGFTCDGRPVGLQMVGRPRGEAELLGAAATLEEILDIAKLVPLDPRPAKP